MRVLYPGQKIRAITGKQSSTLQDYIKTRMDVRYTLLGFGLPLKYRKLAKISGQNPKDHSQHPVIHTKQTFTHRSTDANCPGRNHEVQHQP